LYVRNSAFIFHDEVVFVVVVFVVVVVVFTM
jgi:hypothetical protein